ncbi:MAG: VanZ family protein [Tahibacter sp.]
MSPNPLSHLTLWRGLGRTLVVSFVVVALLPMPSGIGAVPLGDKIGHFLAFAGLVLWYAQIYPALIDRCRCVLGAVALGALIELLQMSVPYRSAEALDLVADALGAGTGLLIAGTPLGRVLMRLDAPRRT